MYAVIVDKPGKVATIIALPGSQGAAYMTWPPVNARHLVYVVAMDSTSRDQPVIAMAVRCSTLVRASCEAVYDGIATKEGLDGWFTNGARVDARPGGEIRFRWREWGPDRITTEDGGPIIEALRPKRFVFSWHPDGPDYATTVAIDFEEVPEGTVIRLAEQGFRDTDSGRRAMLDCAAGWGEALTLWKFYIEHDLRY